MARLAHDSKQDFMGTYGGEFDIEWIKSWPAMSCISVDQWNWTMRTEKAIEAMKTDKSSLKKFEKYMNEQINYIVMIVRGKLDANTKNKLGAVCTLKVHNREIIELFTAETNEKKMITSTKTFEWQSQLR